MKKIILLITLMLILVFGCGKQKETSKSDDSIRIGVPLPLTGDLAQYGVGIKEGIQLHIDEINENGGINGKKLVADYQDTKGDIQESVNIFKKMASDGVDVILGEAISSNTLAIAELANKAKIPMISPAGTVLDITIGKEYIFRTTFTDPYQGKVLAQYLKKEGVTEVALFRNNASDYSTGVGDAFKEEAKKLGINILEQSYTKDDKDFKTLLTKVKNSGIKSVVIPDYYNTIGLILSQAKEVGLDANYYGTDGWDGVQENFADVAEGAIFASQFSPEDTSSNVQEFIAKFRKTYSKDPIIFSALGYDTISILKDALLKNKDLKEALTETDLDLVTGHIKFDENRNPNKKVTFVQLKSGKLTLKEKFGE